MEEGRLRTLKASCSGQGLSYLFFADDLIMYSEAVEEQLMCIREGLELFWKSSGQRVNYGKSSILFSANVDVTEAKRLSDLVGVSPIDRLGKYLG